MMKLYTLETLPTEPGLYLSGGAQVWELDDEGVWGEIHDDGAEFGDYPLIRLVPEGLNPTNKRNPQFDGPAEVPATNDPKPYLRWGTKDDRRADARLGFRFDPRPEFDVEVPADEGTLQERLFALRESSWPEVQPRVQRAPNMRGDDAYVDRRDDERGAIEGFIEEALPLFATELQKARAGGWTRGWVDREPYVDAYYADHQEPNPFEEES